MMRVYQGESTFKEEVVKVVKASSALIANGDYDRAATEIEKLLHVSFRQGYIYGINDIHTGVVKVTEEENGKLRIEEVRKDGDGKKRESQSGGKDAPVCADVV